MGANNKPDGLAEWVRRYIGAGFTVAPMDMSANKPGVDEKGEIPFFSGVGDEHADKAVDAFAVHSAWTGVAIVCGRYRRKDKSFAARSVVCVDIDHKTDADGNVEKDGAACLAHAGITLPPSLESVTPGGGRHVFYWVRAENMPKSSVDMTLADGRQLIGVDIKGGSGEQGISFATVYPSSKRGRSYDWKHDADNWGIADIANALAEYPAELLKQRKAEDSATMTEKDAERVKAVPMSRRLMLAEDWIRKRSEYAVQGQNGSAACMGAVGVLRWGFCLDGADLRAAVDTYNAERCFPPFSEKEMRKKIQDAKPIGRTPGWKLMKEVAKMEHTKTAEPGALLGMVHTWGEISQKVYPPQRWLIEKIIPESTPEDGRTARGLKGDLVAKSKVGKTWLALRIACCVAGGAPYAPGMAPKPPRPVLYVNMELPGNQVQYRVRVIAQALGCDGDELARNLTILTPPPGSAGLFRTEDGATAEFLELCTRYALVVLDPLYKFVLPEEDENAAVDMAKVAAWRDELLDGGTTVLVVHHEIKGKGEGRDITDAGAGSGVLGRDYDFKIWATADETGHRKISYSSRLDRERPEDYAMFNAERGGFEFPEGIARDAVAANFGKCGKSSLTADQRKAVKAVQDGYYRWTDPHAMRTGESLLEAFGMFAEPAPKQKKGRDW